MVDLHTDDKCRFLDEPTSGLDSQTSWAICDLMEKLKHSGQAILCTVHQPSAMLFQRFDRLLFLHKGGQTIYFGPIGSNSQTLTSYFERNGAFPCPKDANPAEWMLEVIGAAPGSHSDNDWHDTWRNSTEFQETRQELDRLAEQRPNETQPISDKESYRAFAAPLAAQLSEVTRRVFSQYWRTPSYIYSKIALCLFSALFIGFVFYNAPLSQQGLQNQMFSVSRMALMLHTTCLLTFDPDIHALPDLRPAGSANYAALRHATSLVRGEGATFEDVLVEGIYVCEHYCRIALEHAHGCNHLHLLLLSHRTLYVLHKSCYYSILLTLHQTATPNQPTPCTFAASSSSCSSYNTDSSSQHSQT